MLAGVQSQIMAAEHVKCVKLTTIALNGSNYLPGGLVHAHGACLTFCMASYVFEMSLKSIFNLVSVAGDM
jgi:hypothetical protein